MAITLYLLQASGLAKEQEPACGFALKAQGGERSADHPCLYLPFKAPDPLRPDHGALKRRSRGLSRRIGCALNEFLQL